MVKLRYAGVRLAENEFPPPSGQITLNKVKVGGMSVEFNGAVVNIGGEPHTPKQWLELRRRIDVELIRRKLIEEVGPPDSREGKSSSFLTNNTTSILKHDRGKFKKPPWWLGWLYSAVVTREEYDYD